MLLKFIGFLTLVPLPLGFLANYWFTRHNRLDLVDSLVLGLFLCSIEAYVVGSLGLSSTFTYLFIIQGIIAWYVFKKYRLKVSFFRPLPPAAILIIFISVFINSQLIFPFASPSPSGLSLMGAHFADSTWHLSLIHSLTRNVPPENPLFSGEILSNYHYFVDLQMSLISHVTGISVPDTFFRLFGPLSLFLFAFLIYTFTYRLSRSQLAATISVLFIALGSNLYYLVTPFFASAQISPSVAWVDFFSSKVVNYPLLVSITLLLLFLKNFSSFTYDFRRSLVFGVLIGFTFAVKTHTAIIMIASLGALAFYWLLNKRFNYLVSFVSSIIIVYLLSSSLVASTGSILKFQPFWYIKVMYESYDHLDYPLWELQRQTLLAGKSFFGIVRLYLSGLFWFNFVNFGALFVGVFALFGKKIASSMKMLLLSLVLSSVLLTHSLIYSSVANVTIQFIYISLLVLSLLFVIFITKQITIPKMLRIALLVIYFSLLLPGNRYLVNIYQSSANQYNISPQLFNVLTTLSHMDYGSVLTDDSLIPGSPVSALTGFPVYVGDNQILDSLGVDYSMRKTEMSQYLSCQASPPVKYILSTRLIPCYRLLARSGPYHLYLASSQNQPK